MISLPPTEMAAKTIAKQNRRIRGLYWLTILFWIAAIGVIAFAGGFLTDPMQTKARTMITTIREVDHPELYNVSHEEKEKKERWLARNAAYYSVATSMGLAYLAGSVVVLALTTLGTILLLHMTRRAALRQIQTSLAEISSQLAELKQRSGDRQP